MTKSPGRRNGREATHAPIESAVRGSLHGLSASAVTLTLGLLRTLLLARLLLPEHFAVVALALVFIGLAARLRSLGIDSALLHRYDADPGFADSSCTAWTTLELLSTGLLLAATPLLHAFYAPLYPSFAAVFPVLVVAHAMAGLSAVQEALLRRDLEFGALARIDVAASLAMTIVAPLLAWWGWGVWALVAEAVSGMGLRMLLTWGPLRRWRPRIGWDRAALASLWDYARPAWLSANLSYALDNFDDFWVGTALGSEPLGLYNRAYVFARYPRRVFASPLVRAVTPVFARLQHDREQLSRLYSQAAFAILRAGFLVAGVFALLIPELVEWVIGEQWAPMAWAFRLMLVYAALDPLRMLTNGLLLALGRPRDLRDAALVQLAFFLPAVVVASRLAGIEGVALAANGMLAIGIWRLRRALRDCIDVSLTKLARWPVLALVAAFAAGFGLEVWAPGAGAVARLAAFLALYGGILAAVEGGAYLRIARELARIVRGGDGEGSGQGGGDHSRDTGSDRNGSERREDRDR